LFEFLVISRQFGDEGDEVLLGSFNFLCCQLSAISSVTRVTSFCGYFQFLHCLRVGRDEGMQGIFSFLMVLTDGATWVAFPMV